MKRYKRTNSLYREKNKLCSTKRKLKVMSLKQENNLYASLFVACQLRDCNLTEFFEHENHSYPPISEYVQICKTNKADFLSCLAEHDAILLTRPEVTAKVIDGMAAVHSLKPVESKTFGEYASNEIHWSVLSVFNIQSLLVLMLFLIDTWEQRGSGTLVSVN